MDYITIFAQVLIIASYSAAWFFRYKRTKISHYKNLLFSANAIRMLEMPTLILNRYAVLVPVLTVIPVFMVWRAGISFFLGMVPHFDFSFDFLIRAVILAPIAETIIMVLMINALVIWLAGKRVDLHINILIFCVAVSISLLFHMPSSINGFLTRTLCFCMFGLLYWYSNKNALPAIIAHAVWNALLMV